MHYIGFFIETNLLIESEAFLYDDPFKLQYQFYAKTPILQKRLYYFDKHVVNTIIIRY